MAQTPNIKRKFLISILGAIIFAITSVILKKYGFVNLKVISLILSSVFSSYTIRYFIGLDIMKSIKCFLKNLYIMGI